MAIAIGQDQERGLFDLVDDWLKKIDLFLSGGQVYYYFRQLI